MKVAFVGVKRKYQELPSQYIHNFNRYHLELPYYFARDGGNDVTISTVDMNLDSSYFRMIGDGLKHPNFLEMKIESEFAASDEKFDVVIHWRRWFPELYRPEAINLINCQDHSFSQEWKQSVRQAMNEGKLNGILCFPAWHKKNLHEETGIPLDRLYDGVTLGVDTGIYIPAIVKDPFQMLWASDPGRGLIDAIKLAIQLFSKDKRYRLNICYPDYVTARPVFNHPALVMRGNVSNGPELWNLFNSTGVLPYTSCFKEPSSRAHRQAQSAGSLVMYPKNMGTPSDLIESGKTGIVADIDTWSDTINDLVQSGKWKEIGDNARKLAVSENWEVQSKRFNNLMERLIGEKNG